MTIQQLYIVLEVVKTGSISRAAANLHLSQPNASNSIRTLEKDLGYELFERTNTGIRMTDQCVSFLDHARRVLREIDGMQELKNSSHLYRFRVGILSYAPTVEAFLRLCSEYADREKADLLCLNMSDSDGIRAVGNMDLDMMATLISTFDTERTRHNTERYGLSMIFIKSIPLNINLRKGHPLLREGNTFELSQLADYTYVAYEKIPNLVETASNVLNQFISYRYRIAVDERETRCRIVGMTDAFSIGCQLPDWLMERYGIVSVRVSDARAGLYCIVRSGDENREEVRRYIEILKEEVGRI